jgi:hypothetical protein
MRDKTFLKGFMYGVITTIMLAFLIFVSINVINSFQVEVIIEKAWLERKLDISGCKIIGPREVSVFPLKQLETIYDGIIIDTMYIGDNERVMAFHYQIDSGYLGIAVIRYDSRERIRSIEFYNQFDLGLKEIFKPSHILHVLNLGSELIVYDEFSESIYVKKDRFLVKEN